jgi:type II secretion system protein G
MGPLRALKIIISPARAPLIQLLAAIGLLVSFVIVVAGLFGNGERRMDPNRILYMPCNVQVQKVSTALEHYRADCGDYPKDLRGLIADEGIEGWHGPYLEELPPDPWGRPLLYLRSSNDSVPEIWSYGADGKPGGGFFDADISSRDLWRLISESAIEVRTRRLILATWISVDLLRGMRCGLKKDLGTSPLI